MKKILFISIISLCFCNACSFHTHYLQTNSTYFPATDPDQVEIYSHTPDREYIVIGSVAVDIFGNDQSAVKKLKKEVAKLGAHAVINTQLTRMTTAGSRSGLTGVAVRFPQNNHIVTIPHSESLMRH